MWNFHISNISIWPKQKILIVEMNKQNTIYFQDTLTVVCEALKILFDYRADTVQYKAWLSISFSPQTERNGKELIRTHFPQSCKCFQNLNFCSSLNKREKSKIVNVFSKWIISPSSLHRTSLDLLSQNGWFG